MNAQHTPGPKQRGFLESLVRDGGTHKGWRYGAQSQHDRIVGSLVRQGWIGTNARGLIFITNAGRAAIAKAPGSAA